uniref:HATPase_c domain-containing protein n=1 Tax=Parastrongyloides trichosuri TaxID=131310 RepID=A0A0N4Z9C3_PARTI
MFTRSIYRIGYLSRVANGLQRQILLSRNQKLICYGRLSNFSTSTDSNSVPSVEKFEFQAEVKNLLNIVAESLYSDQEVFIRELISNASDAIEKRRCRQMTESVDASKVVEDSPLEIKIEVDEKNNRLIITDTGIGMTRDELISCLGTIAKSGSKDFMDINKEKASAEQIIGQFGVGFYSALIVSKQLRVITRKWGSDIGFAWTWDGATGYKIEKVHDIPYGTRIELDLKDGDCAAFSKIDRVKEIINKYSYFITVPILLEGERINTMNALWTKHPREVTDEMNENFYKQLVLTHHQHLMPERPQYTIHYKTDAPISIRALLYVPTHKVSQLEYAASSSDSTVSLYARNVLIKANAKELLPRYLRFLVGVVDSEDVPLNLSRELVQMDRIILKLKKVLTEKIMSFFIKQQKKDRVKYTDFYNGYSMYFKEGVCLEVDQAIKESISNLLLFESSKLRKGETTTLHEYVERMKVDQKEIYYLYTPNRHLAETSPYYEMFKNNGYEVLFIYDPADEIVMSHLPQYDKKYLVPVEQWVKNEGSKLNEESKSQSTNLEKEEFLNFVKTSLGQLKVDKVQASYRQSDHPAILTISSVDHTSVRNLLRTGQIKNMEHMPFLKPTLILSMNHPVIVGAMKLRKNNKELASLVLEQVYDNALVSAGLMKDSSLMISRINKLMSELMQQERSTILTP